MNNNDPKNKKTMELLQRLGIDAAEVSRESAPELLIPKMAILGFLETLLRFCESGKASIAASLTGLNCHQLRLLLSAMKGSIDLVERTLDQYENLRKQARARDLVDNIIPIFRKPENDNATKSISQEEMDEQLRKDVGTLAPDDDDDDCNEEADEEADDFLSPNKGPKRTIH